MLQSSIKELQDNYYLIEGQIASETIKQQATQKERYSQVLDKIQVLKKLLKIEVEQRKNTEVHLKAQIEEKSKQILARFSADYLNKLQVMQVEIGKFAQRKLKLSSDMENLSKTVNSKLNEQRVAILSQISEKK